MLKPRPNRFLLAGLLCLTPGLSALAQSGPNVLFVRGADGSGGATEGGDRDDRTEQLADIFNTSSTNLNGGTNHGWGELGILLTNAGYNISQVVEAAEDPTATSTDGLPVAFDTMDLSVYDVIVFGSNNAVYTTAQVDAVENYVRNGGGAIFISDANFGSTWADASNSDQQFLDRFGLNVLQDTGRYAIQRADGEFLDETHPIFENVDAFDGEGVTPFTIGTLATGDTATILANAEGNVRENNGTSGNFQGSTRAANAGDAALLVAEIGDGRVIGHYDRNTFFNDGGAGTDITRFDNEQYALNLFAFAAVPEPSSAILLGLAGLGLFHRRRR